MATTQEAVQISAIVPTLTVNDLQRSITFYEALGSRSTSGGNSDPSGLLLTIFSEASA